LQILFYFSIWIGLRSSLDIELLKFVVQTLPALFVQQHCDKIRESVELQNEVTRRNWTVQLAVHYPRRITQVLFYGRGWSDFATSNGLAEGDRLIFVLRRMSTFEVSVFPNGIKTAVPGEPAPLERRKTKFETTLILTDESRDCKFEDKVTAHNIKNSVPPVSDVLAKNWIAEETVADSASECWIKVPLNSPRNSPNFFGQPVIRFPYTLSVKIPRLCLLCIRKRSNLTLVHCGAGNGWQLPIEKLL
jgi:hypothetical protein